MYPSPTPPTRSIRTPECADPMSAIAGICHTDSRPADAGLLARMLDRLAARGPHGRKQWMSGSVGLGHRLLHTTPESLKEHQPLSDA